MPSTVEEEKTAPEPATPSAYSNPFEPIQTETKVEEFDDEIEDLEEEADEFEDY